jgi:hypothetical protein
MGGNGARGGGEKIRWQDGKVGEKGTTLEGDPEHHKALAFGRMNARINTLYILIRHSFLWTLQLICPCFTLIKVMAHFRRQAVGAVEGGGQGPIHGGVEGQPLKSPRVAVLL